jgi:hypothetical protein
MVYHYQCSIHYYKTSNIVAGPICSATIVTVLTVVVDLMMSHVRHYTSCGRRVTSSEPPLLFVCSGGLVRLPIQCFIVVVIFPILLFLGFMLHI